MLATLLDFGGRRRAKSLENPSTPLSDHSAFGDSFFDVGPEIPAEKAVKIAAVWQALNMISGDIAKMPLDVYRRIEPQGREKDLAHPAQRLLRFRSNDQQTAFRLKRASIIHLLLWGNAYQYIERDGGGRPVGLTLLLPDRTEPRRRREGLYYVAETTDPAGHPFLKWIPAENVIHLQGFTFDGLEGEPLLAAARDSWLVALSQNNFSSRFYRSGGTMGGVLEIPREVSQEYADNLEEGWRKRYEDSDSWFRTAILRDGAKFHNASFSPTDADSTNASEREVRQVARWFNLPPSRLGLADAVSYNSKSESNQEYLDTTLDPILVDYEQEAHAKLLGDDRERYVEFNRASILRMNHKDQSQIHAIGIRNGWLSPDEVRAQLNMPARADGRGGDYADVNRAKSPGGADKGENDAPRGDGKTGLESEGERGRGGEGETSDERHRRRRIVYQIGARARHKSANLRAWQEFLEGNLASFRRESVELVGSDELVTEIVERLRPTLDVGTRDLPAAVDRIMGEIEKDV